MPTRLLQKGSILLTCALLWLPESSALSIQPARHGDTPDAIHGTSKPIALNPGPRNTVPSTPLSPTPKPQDPAPDQEGQLPMPPGSAGIALDLFSPVSLPATELNARVSFMSILPAPLPYSNTRTPEIPADMTVSLPQLNAPVMNAGNENSYFDDMLFNKLPDNGAQNMARTSVVPEPTTTLILCLGALGMGIRTRWHQG